MSKERTVVLAIDGSEYSDYALDWYKKYVHIESDKVICVNCPEYHQLAYSPYVDEGALRHVYETEKKKNEEFIESLKKKLNDISVYGKVMSIRGNPGEEICRVASEEHATLIVIGTRGLGTVRRTFLGSVSDYVVHHSHIPVLVTRHIDHQQKRGVQK